MDKNSLIANVLAASKKAELIAYYADVASEPVTLKTKAAAEEAIGARFADLSDAEAIEALRHLAEFSVAAQKAINAHEMKVANAPKADEPAPWRFPKAADFAPRGWDKIEGGAEMGDDEFAKAMAAADSDANAEEMANPKPVAEAPKTPKPSAFTAANSLGVAKSWEDGEVRVARLVRETVFAYPAGAPESKTEFRSVREAFRNFRLPDSKHIKFRLGLKATRRATFTEGDLSIVFEYADAPAE